MDGWHITLMDENLVVLLSGFLSIPSSIYPSIFLKYRPRYLNHITHLDVTSHIHLLNSLLLVPEPIWFIFACLYLNALQEASLTAVGQTFSQLNICVPF